MATFQKVNSFVELLAEKTFNLGSDVLTIALTNTAHNSAWTKLSDLTQVSYANLSSRVLTVSSSAQTSGVYKLVVADQILSATGTVGPFQYVYIYDDTATNDELIGYYDFGSAITLSSGAAFTIDFDGTNGVFSIT